MRGRGMRRVVDEVVDLADRAGDDRLALRADVALGVTLSAVGDADGPRRLARYREVLDADKLLAPEQKVVLDPDHAAALALARRNVASYLRLPNYVNNLRRLGYTDIAMLATVGRHHVWVYEKPQVGIIATGDELVDVGDDPLDYQVRNSNVESLAVQVARAGGRPY